MKKRILVDAVALFAILAIIVYVIMRSLLHFYAEYSVTDKIASLSLMLAEFFIIIHGFGYTLSVIRAYHSKKDKDKIDKISLAGIQEEPSVAVLVAARHEPREVLEETFRSLKNLNYKNKKVYFLDDSSDEKYMKEAEAIVEELGLELFRRETRHGAKAGIVNDCLETLDQRYIAIFDADQSPLPEFLNKLLPLLENDEKLAFVQTPQFYTNINESRVAKASAFQQAVFYEYICESKSSQNAMFCCGTNIVFRRDALVEVGGLDETTVTEDFATSIKLHSSGWRSLYYNHVYAFGMAPENLVGYFQQQFRWANGTLTTLKVLLRTFITRPFSLTVGQWWEYFLSSTYYLVGFAFFVLMTFPLLYLFLKIPAFFSKPEIYILAFFPYITLSVSVFYFVLKDRNYTVKDLFAGQMLGSTTFPVYVRAAVSSFLGIKTTFGVTQKIKGSTIPYIRLWPQLTIVFLNFIAVIWGVNRFIYEREPAIIINSFWAFYHLIILSSIFYFNGEKIREKRFNRLSRKIKINYRVTQTPEETKNLNKKFWKYGITLFLPEYLSERTRLMCKISPEKNQWIIFEAVIVWSSERRKHRGFETSLGVIAIAENDKEKLRKVIKV